MPVLKDNIIQIDWTDEVLNKTVLTHAGAMYDEAVPSKNKKPATQVA